ncbi:MAG: D-serine ammonia-lyase [Spirochaeta sp.]|nr:D-serine ammonia-lyase [Spirochaeta sp.]
MHRKLIKSIRRAKPVFFHNRPQAQLVLGPKGRELGISPDGPVDAANRMRRAQGLVANLFPAASFAGSPGRIESPLRALTGFEPVLAKCDGELPHMSRDAKQWKKDLLRSHGARVVEHGGDFSAAVRAGRDASAASPRSYFVDDENSTRLLYGYAAAAVPLRQQLAERGIYPSADHPLCVYLPCGVGGGPAGISYGLALEFGAHAVESYTVEPTQAPALLLAVLEGRYAGLHVSEYGLTLATDADGLAVGSASVLAAPIIGALCSGLYTESDDTMRAYLRHVYASDGLRLELSAAAGLGGPARRAQLKGLRSPAAEVVWLTGGGLLPEDEFQLLLR